MVAYPEEGGYKCMDCGLQMFVRSSAGEERLKERCLQPATVPVAKGGEPS